MRSDSLKKKSIRCMNDYCLNYANTLNASRNKLNDFQSDVSFS